MNFLAHIYLSGNDEEIKIGNFIGDYVKGKDYKQYPEKIQKGILVHREIDHFTDHHPIVQRSKSHLKMKYPRFSGIVMDVFYDHFLSVEWKRYSKIPLQDFIQDFYGIIYKYYHIIPAGVKQFAPFFVINNWLESNQSLDGIEGVLYRMSHRTSLPAEALSAMDVLKHDYSFFHKGFIAYFPELISHVEQKTGIQIRKG